MRIRNRVFRGRVAKLMIIVLVNPSMGRTSSGSSKKLVEKQLLCYNQEQMLI